ncbi:hypothetical protein HHX47_DHR1001030 [Lentinula edodes]|nr:hypothetical protein HHX47_DHR1001030 [Lentinula edodes]
MHSLLLVSAALSAVGLTSANPVDLERRTVTTLSATELSSFAPFTQFARAAYCGTDILQDWTCGDFVGYITHPFDVPVIVTEIRLDIRLPWKPSSWLMSESDLTDIDVPLAPLSSTLFPGISSDVEVHTGFQDEHALTADAILAEVKSLMSSVGTSNIVAVGHSLGGALAEIDTIFFRLNIPSATISAMTYGTPRVGNPAWAALVDASDVCCINVPSNSSVLMEALLGQLQTDRQYARYEPNPVSPMRPLNVACCKDLIPIVPGRALGYEHPAGEIHILSPGDAVSCPGDDDATDSECQIVS